MPVGFKLWLSFCALGAVGSDSFAAEKPNIVFIYTDDLGINDLSCYGRHEHDTPHLDKLAADGVRFTASYCAQPICSPSRAAVLTGKAPARLHLTTFLPGRRDASSQRLLHPPIQTQLPLEERTLAEYLGEIGYATACVGKWHLGGPKFGPAAQGFGVVHTGRANTQPSADEGGKGEYDLTRAAIQFIEANKDRPFFLYLPHNTPHIPLAAKPELVEKYRATFHPVYAAMMHTMDDVVGLVLAKLDELKLTERTIVVFTSDNGGLHVPELNDGPPTHNTPYRAGKGFVYEGGLRVPTIVRWPGNVPAGKVINEPFINTDWLPTFLDIVGMKPAEPLDGVSILPLLTGKEQPARTFYWHFPHYTNQGSRPAGAVREGNWKYIEHYEDGTAELYDLADDVGETRNLAADHPDKVKELRAKLAAWRKEVGAQENTPNPAFDPALHQAIYLDVDVSQLKPAATSTATWEPYREWRQRMDAAVRK
jgi:arylsulfatase A-like enzyme